jgi:hypothetical protein
VLMEKVENSREHDVTSNEGMTPVGITVVWL